MPQSPLPPEHGSGLSAALPYLSAIGAAGLTWLAARYTAFAQLSKTVLDASRRLVDQTQALHAQDGALIVEKDEKIEALRLELLLKGGEIRQHLQQRDSITVALEKEQRRVKALEQENSRLEREIEALEGRIENLTEGN
jgi:peptidoglycan hydrolase CwlO-like protein